MESSKTRSVKSSRGMTLLIVLCVMALLMVIAMGMISTSGKSLMGAGDARQELRARVAAEAVISAAVADAVNRAGEVFGGTLENSEREITLQGDKGTAEVEFYTASGGASLQQGIVPAGPLKGLMGYKYGCGIEGTGRSAGSGKRKIHAEVLLYQVPIFQFGVFFDSSLEITPGPTMRVFGRVHTNDSLYARGQSDLHFTGPLTAAGIVCHWLNGGSLGYQYTPADPTEYSPSSSVLGSNITMMTAATAPPLVNGVRNVRWSQTKIHLALGGNSNSNPHAIIEPAKSSDLPALQRQNYDWITKTKSSPAARYIAGVTPSMPAWITGPRVFWDRREWKWVKVWDFDVRALRLSSNRDSIFYFADTVLEMDRGTGTADTVIKALRIVNADTLGRNLCIATVNPIYVMGNFNVGRSVSTDSTSYWNAQLAGDVFTLLSPLWRSWDSSRAAVFGTGSTGTKITSCEQAYSNPSWGCPENTGSKTGKWSDSTRITNVRVNAALLLGNKQANRDALQRGASNSTFENYEGGLHNDIRLLEDWTNHAPVIKGSIVCVWQGQTRGLEKRTSVKVISRGHYTAPTRYFGFDDRFLQLGKMPPGTPFLATAIFTNWLEK